MADVLDWGRLVTGQALDKLNPFESDPESHHTPRLQNDVDLTLVLMVYLLARWTDEQKHYLTHCTNIWFGPDNNINYRWDLKKIFVIFNRHLFAINERTRIEYFYDTYTKGGGLWKEDCGWAEGYQHHVIEATEKPINQGRFENRFESFAARIVDDEYCREQEEYTTVGPYIGTHFDLIVATDQQIDWNFDPNLGIRGTEYEKYVNPNWVDENGTPFGGYKTYHWVEEDGRIVLRENVDGNGDPIYDIDTDGDIWKDETEPPNWQGHDGIQSGIDDDFGFQVSGGCTEECVCTQPLGWYSHSLVYTSFDRYDNDKPYPFAWTKYDNPTNI